MNQQNKIFETLLRKLIREIIVEKKKPGGGITKIGAEKILHPASAKMKIKSAIRGEKGDISGAADYLDVSTRTLYSYIDDDKSLEKIKDEYSEIGDQDSDAEDEEK